MTARQGPPSYDLYDDRRMSFGSFSRLEGLDAWQAGIGAVNIHDSEQIEINLAIITLSHNLRTLYAPHSAPS